MGFCKTIYKTYYPRYQSFDGIRVWFLIRDPESIATYTQCGICCSRIEKWEELANAHLIRLYLRWQNPRIGFSIPGF